MHVDIFNTRGCRLVVYSLEAVRTDGKNNRYISTYIKLLLRVSAILCVMLYVCIVSDEW